MKKILTVLLTALLFAPSFALAQKIGLIDAQRIIEISNFRQVTEQKLEQQFKPTQTALESLKKSIDERIAKLKKQRLTLTLDSIATEEASIQKDQVKLQIQARQAQSQFEASRQKELTEFDKLVHKHVEQYALKHNFDLIMFKTATAWHATSLDITDEILKTLPKFK